MLYASLDDANNDTFKDKLDQYDNMNKHERIYNDNNPHINRGINFPSFFTAQGDYESNNYKGNTFCSTKGPEDIGSGTTINQLKNNQNNTHNNVNNNDTNQSLMSSFSFEDSSDDKSLKTKYKKKELDHDYCVNIITKELLNNNDSLMSSHNGKIYKHVKTCIICKNKIKNIMKEQYCKPDVTLPKEHIVEHFEEPCIIGYDMKELVLIILGGIILIFIFDLLVKMGTKLRN
jgi:hypothetical protein